MIVANQAVEHLQDAYLILPVRRTADVALDKKSGVR